MIKKTIVYFKDGQCLEILGDVDTSSEDEVYILRSLGSTFIVHKSEVKYIKLVKEWITQQ